MAPRIYRNFDLVVERAGDDFDVHVVDSPAGEAHGTFAMPFGEHELENFVLKMGARRGVRRAGSAPRTAAQAFGQTLYGAVFTPDVEYALRQSLQDCQGRGEGLRVRLRLHNAPELMDVPWEYLHSTALGRPLALSVDTPLVRYMDMGQAVEALEVAPPLRILVVVSSPTDIEQLDTEKELANLREATAELVRDGRIEVHALASPTVADLQHQLRKEAFHILHFMGHGIFDEATGTGMLAFEDDEGRARPVPGSDLGMMLHDHRNLQMVVLNACEGARTSVQDPLGGVAQSLARAGIPAVVAMQFEISDAAAKRFSRELYLAIADGYPVDAAVSEARKALYLQDRATEWGTPVLHLRAADGQIFDLKAAPKPAEVPTLMEEVEARAEEDGLGEISAIGILQRILVIDPDNATAADQLARLQASARRDKPGSVATGGDDSRPVAPAGDRHDPDDGPVDVPDDRDDPSGEADGAQSVGSGDPEPADDPEPSRSAGTAAAAGAGAAAAAGAAAGAGGAGTGDAAPDVAMPTTERVGTDRAVVDPPPDPIPDPAPTVPPVQTRQVPPSQPPGTNAPRRVAAPAPAPVIPPAGTPDVGARRQPGPTPPAGKGGATPPPVPADSSSASSPWPRRIGFVLAVLFGVFAVLVVIGIIVGEEPSADPTLGPFATPQVDPPETPVVDPPETPVVDPPEGGLPSWYGDVSSLATVAVAVSDPPVIDGDLSEWPSDGYLIDIGQTVHGNPEVGGVGMVTWDTTALYVSASVGDSFVDQAWQFEPSQLWRGDSLNFEWAVGPSNDPDQLVQDGALHVLLGPDDGVNGVLPASNPASGGVFQAGGVEPAIELASTLTGGGYDIEAAIPWVVLGGGPDVGDVVGFNLNISNGTGDGGFSSMTSSTQGRTSPNQPRPACWGRLLMWDDPSVGPGPDQMPQPSDAAPC